MNKSIKAVIGGGLLAASLMGTSALAGDKGAPCGKEHGLTFLGLALAYDACPTVEYAPGQVTNGGMTASREVTTDAGEPIKVFAKGDCLESKIEDEPKHFVNKQPVPVCKVARAKLVTGRDYTPKSPGGHKSAQPVNNGNVAFGVGGWSCGHKYPQGNGYCTDGTYWGTPAVK